MNVNMTWCELKPNTVIGYGVQISTVVTSQDESEIKEYIEWLKKSIGDGIVTGAKNESKTN